MKWWLALAAFPLSAHVMSMSTGEASVSGNRVDYILRIPYYEVEQMPHPETTLLQHVQFEGGRMQHEKCFRDGESYVCAADYLFDKPVETLDVNCTLYAVTVPNHVHALRATKDGREDQAFFDYTFTNATLRFQPETAAETAIRRMMEGGLRGVDGVVQLLFVLTLALAARSRGELLAVVAAFVAGVGAGSAIPWQPAPRFAECAAAIGVAYLAVEILFVPEGGWRWVIAGALGGFLGLYLKLFMNDGGAFFVAGASLTAAVFCAAAGLLMLRRVPRWAAAIPLAAGLFWFFTRMRA
jgi:hypothetical protein